MKFRSTSSLSDEPAVFTVDIEVLHARPPPPPRPVAAAQRTQPPAQPARAHEHARPHARSRAQPASVAPAEEPQPPSGGPATPIDFTDQTLVVNGWNANRGGDGARGSTGLLPGEEEQPATAASHAPSVSDGSRVAPWRGSRDWSCPFPPESDTAQIDEAFVTLVVSVRADGTAAAIHIVSDPGHGFGREARLCALTERFAPAFDAEGRAVTGTTEPIVVHFVR